MKLKLLMFLVISLPHLVGAEEIVVVPGENIQEAIDGASPGDVIKVQSGTYQENLRVDKMLTLLGVDTGGGKPVVDASAKGPAISLNEDGIRIEGFTVTKSVRTSESENETRSDEEGDNLYLEYVGILINGADNCTVANSIAALNQCGIAVAYSSNSSVEKNKVTYSECGIFILNASYGTIEDNIVSESFEVGIGLSVCDNNAIIGNKVVKSGTVGDGIWVSGSKNIIADNDVSENPFYGIVLRGNDNTISNNRAQDNGKSGLKLLGSFRNNVSGNDFSQNGESGISISEHCNDNVFSENVLNGNGMYGVYLENSSDNTIVSNDAIHNEWGIGLCKFSNNNTIMANNASSNLLGITLWDKSNYNQIFENDISLSERYGIQLMDSSNNSIAENIVYHNGGGIGLFASSDENIIERNNASYNKYSGIDLDDCHDNVVRRNRADYNEWGGIGLYLGCEKNIVEDNDVGYNNWAGISLAECDGNVVASNNITRNVRGGIKLQRSRDNLLYQNDLVENALDGTGVKATSPLIQSLLGMAQDKRVRNAYDDAKNQWDNGTVGNYYTDFDCTDADGDGTCDSERAIPGGESVDRYPLARPVN